MSAHKPLSHTLRSLNQRVRPGLSFFLTMLAALAVFEIFNYSTTEHALQDLLGAVQFGAMRWSTMLALAFCAIDLAGIARIFTPSNAQQDSREAWYLYGAWLVAATMNAILTWWGVSMAIANHTVYSSAIIDPGVILNVVPVFVALMVWVIRILIIGSLARALSAPSASQAVRLPSYTPSQINGSPFRSAVPAAKSFSGRTPLQRKPAARPLASMARPMAKPAGTAEPTYHSLSAAPRDNSASTRQF